MISAWYYLGVDVPEMLVVLHHIWALHPEGDTCSRRTLALATGCEFLGLSALHMAGLFRLDVKHEKS